MTKYLSIIVGGLVTIVGILGMVRWMGNLLIVLKGSVPVILVFGGVIAVIAGLAEIKDEAAAKVKNK